MSHKSGLERNSDSTKVQYIITPARNHSHGLKWTQTLDHQPRNLYTTWKINFFSFTNPQRQFLPSLTLLHPLTKNK